MAEQETTPRVYSYGAVPWTLYFSDLGVKNNQMEKKMRKFFILCVATIMLSAGASAEEVKKSDLLAGVKKYGSDMGMLDSCLAWASETLPRPNLSDKIEAAMFDKDLSADSLEYFQKTYKGAYVAMVEEGSLFLDLTKGELCNTTMTPELVAKGSVNAEKVLLDLIEKYRK